MIPGLYIRPLSFVYGSDARSLIAAGEAGALGGLGHIGFSRIEIITRHADEISRRFDTYKTWRDHPIVRNIIAPRKPFGGMAMDGVRVMGILNITPDSFSDGGVIFDPHAAVARGRVMMEEGADLLDIGGESTRPGSDVVSAEDEQARVLPVIDGLRDLPVSVDTRNASTMLTALHRGARIVNDVSALTHDPESRLVVASAAAPVILMHAQGAPKTMQLNPRYDDVALDVYDALEKRASEAMAAGVAPENIMIDPGIGFGKSFQHNLELMRQTAMFHGLGFPILVGLSRKGFVGALTDEATASRRLGGSIGGALQAAMHGIHMLRVHDVKETVAALKVFNASLDPDSALT